MRAAITLVCVACLTAVTGAQTDPIRCWWRTSSGAIAIGQTFDATLTCAVREQDTTRTLPDESRLAAAVAQLAPFEVLGGSHPADLRSPTHRFFQYHYALRIIDRDVIGGDARFPQLQIPYRVQTLSSGEWISGRERMYVIPAHAVRVLSHVPLDASDIRDSGGGEFAPIEELRFRARALDVAGYALLALGIIVAIPAVASLARRRKTIGNAAPRAVPEHAVRRAVTGELATIGRQSGDGWTADGAGRALAVLRVAAAMALGREVACRPVVPGGTPAGLVVSHGLVRKHHMSVWSAVTGAEIAAATAHASASRAMALSELGAALERFTHAVYGEHFRADGLDEAFSAARGAVERLPK